MFRFVISLLPVCLFQLKIFRRNATERILPKRETLDVFRTYIMRKFVQGLSERFKDVVFVDIVSDSI